MSVAAHAAGGASPSMSAATAVVVATTAISALVLGRASSPATHRAGAATPIGAVVLLDQVVAHVLLHLEHVLSGRHAAMSGAVSPGMPTGAHAGHAVLSATPGDHAMGTAPSVSMLLPSPAMLAAHVIGAVVAGMVLAAAFVLADRVTAARHRVLSRPRLPATVGRPSLRRTGVIGAPTPGHVRLDRSRGPPLQLV